MPKILPNLIPLAAILACTLTLPTAHAQTSPATQRAPASTFQIRLVLPDADTTTPADTFPDPADPAHILRVAKDILLDASALASAKADTSHQGHPVVNFTLTPDGAKRFAQITTTHLQRKLAILHNDGNQTTLLAAPIIQSPITGGTGAISFSQNTPKADVGKLASALTPPAPFTKEELLLLGWWQLAGNTAAEYTITADHQYELTVLSKPSEKGTWTFHDAQLKFTPTWSAAPPLPAPSALHVTSQTEFTLAGTTADATPNPMKLNRNADAAHPGPGPFTKNDHHLGLVNFPNDPDLAAAMQYDGETALYGKTVPGGRARAEQHYLAALDRVTDSLLRARIFAHLGILYSTNFNPNFGESADYAKSAAYLKKAIAEEPTRISMELIRARLHQVSPLLTHDDAIQLRRQNLAYLQSLTPEIIKKNWLPSIPGESPSDDQLAAFQNFLTNVIDTQIYNLGASASRGSAPQPATTPR